MFGDHRPGVTNVWEEFQAKRAEKGYDPEAGIDQIIFVMQAGNNRHQHIMESLELFGTEVLPEFAERDEARRARKAERLAPAVEAAMARKVVDAPPLPEGYVMEALPKQFLKAVGGEELLDKIAGDTSVGAPDPMLNGSGSQGVSRPHPGVA